MPYHDHQQHCENTKTENLSETNTMPHSIYVCVVCAFASVIFIIVENMEPD